MDRGTDGRKNWRKQRSWWFWDRTCLLCWGLAIGAGGVLAAPGGSSSVSVQPAAFRLEESGVELLQLSSRVWLHVSSVDLPGYGRVSANGLVIVGEKEALLLDTPWTNAQTAALFDWAEQSLSVPMSWVVPSHSHDDCAGGLEAAHRRGARSIAHALTRDFLLARNRPAPGQTFTDTFSIDLGGLEVLLEFVGPGHSKDNIVAWIRNDRIVFGGCLVKSLDARSIGNTADADLPAWPGTLRKLLDSLHEEAVIVPGHGSPGGSAEVTRTLWLLAKAGFS